MTRHRWLTLLMLLLLFSRLTLEARHLSFTSDEPSHIASGYAYLDQGATWTIPLRGHPLLLDAWIALPFYLAYTEAPLATLPGWQEDNTQFVQAFVPYIEAQLANAETATRLPTILLTVLLAAVVSRWAEDLSGRTGGRLALATLLFDPTLLAHGMLATNDAGVTALGTAALFATYRLIRHPKTKRLVTTGGLLGMTLLAKGSGIIWLAGSLGMMGIAGLQAAIREQPGAERRRALGRWFGYGVGATIVALLGVWAAYGFEIGPLPQLGLSIPAPAPTHWQGIFAQSSGADERWTYFLGQVRRGGHWAYFPVAMALKNPIPLLLLAIWGGIHRLRTGLQRGFRQPALVIFPVLYAGVAVWTGVNIGYRHMLPLHPFLYLLISAVPGRRRRARYARAGMIAALGLVSATTAPFHLSFFNILAGGPSQGWRYLADSNTDWGQGKKYLYAYEQSIDQTLNFSGPEGYVGLAAYQIDYTPLPPIPSNPEAILKPWIHPAPGRYVISHNSLSGLGMIAPDNYAWFRYHKPERIIADVLSVYQVPALPNRTWLAQCTTPLAPLDQPAINEGFPKPPTRVFGFDCTQTWVYPDADDGEGWYALHAERLQHEAHLWRRLGLRRSQAKESFTARHIEDLATTYRQWDYRNTPAFIVYQRAGATAPAAESGSDVFVAAAATPPETLTAQTPAPVALQGPLAYAGVRAYPTAGGLDVETWWRVEKEGIARPFSIMAHLVTAQGKSLGVADGLGIAPANLREGDIVVQAHHFPDAPSPEQLWLRTGAYWLDTGERWPVGDEAMGETANDAVFVPLREATP